MAEAEKKRLGYNGKILHVDLSTKKTEIEEPAEAFYRTYLGGGLLGTYYLVKGTKPGVDPLSPENVLVLAPSVVTARAWPTMDGRTSSSSCLVSFRSRRASGRRYRNAARIR